MQKIVLVLRRSRYSYSYSNVRPRASDAARSHRAIWTQPVLRFQLSFEYEYHSVEYEYEYEYEYREAEQGQDRCARRFAWWPMQDLSFTSPGSDKQRLVG